MDSIFSRVEKNVDDLVRNNADWTACATYEQLRDAREGKLRLDFYGKSIPMEWLSDIKGKRVLCLAGAGGLQAPLLACAGADVSVIDISDKMLEKDREIAKREKLKIRIAKGNMCNLSQFCDGEFDYIINPPSLMYVPEIKVVFQECCRVLKQYGTLIIMAPNPINYVCDYITDEKGNGYYKAVHKMPFCSLDYDDSGWIEYGHTMEEYLGGLLECGFWINGYMECQMEDITELYFLVRAVKR